MKISKTDFNLQSGHKQMVEIPMFTVRREISAKGGKSELRFINSAHRLTKL